MSNRFRNWVLVIVLTLCSVVVIAVGIMYYFIATPSAAKVIVDQLMLQSSQYGSVTFESLNGTLGEGVVLKGVTVNNAPILGRGVLIRVQEMTIKILPWEWYRLHVSIFNGRLNLPHCDPIVFNGHYINGVFDGNVYGKSADVSVIMKPFLLPQVWKILQGSISDIDFSLSLKGHNPRIAGHFYVERIQYAQTIVRNGLARFDLTFVEDRGVWRMNGPLILENGLVDENHRTIELQQSQAVFKGDPLNPGLSIYGTAKADIYTIDLSIKGTLLRPLVHFSSDPYLPEDMASLVLGFGNWTLSNPISQYNNGGRTIELKKKISDDVKLGVELEQLSNAAGQQPSYSQKLSGELAITDKFSFNITEKVLSEQNYSPQNSSASSAGRGNQGESEFYLKYKNRF